MIADSNNFFFECDRSNSNAKIPHATVGRAAPATNRRRQSFTASLTCATRAGSSLLTAAIINTTHKTRPKAFKNIRALINRCPTGEPLHHSRLAFAAQPTMCGPAGSKGGPVPVACTWFPKNRVRCFDGAGGGSWRGYPGDLLLGRIMLARRPSDVLDNLLSRFLQWSGLLSHLSSYERYDEPETLAYSIRPCCPMSG